MHQECKLLPVRKHLEMLSKQFLANTMQSLHPSHDLVTAPPEPCPKLKPSLQTKYGSAISPFLSDGVIKRHNYKKVLSAIHTSDTNAAISSLDNNRVLGSKPPEINQQEKLLPRVYRSTLSQLRSGYCLGLKDYQLEIKKATDDRCPDCLILPQTSFHIFNCPANPTNLSTSDLWRRPREVAEFLSTISSFSYLPLLDPPPPPPPPEPPATGAGWEGDIPLMDESTPLVINNNNNN